MAGELFESGTAAPPTTPQERRIYGVVVAKVIDNMDALSEGRVQISIPWLSTAYPFARIATLMGGMLRGTYFIPQVNDEVLVVFNNGDTGEPYIIGSLWSTVDRPPAQLPTDPLNTRKIRTPLGHDLSFDDVKQTITITNTAQHTITLSLDGIEIANATETASVKLAASGSVTIKSATDLTIDAPRITIKGASVKIEGSASTSISGGATCDIKAGQVNIN